MNSILVIYIGTIFVLIIGTLFYAQAKLKNKLLCTFRRADKTKVEKLVSAKSRYIFYNNGRYNVNPRRITLFWYARGIHQFFPQWIPSLDFSWDSPDAIDPETFQNTWDTPEAREASQQEDSFKAFAKGIASQAGSKGRFPEWFFPIIIIGLVVVLGYWIYQMSGQIAQIQQLISIKLK